MSAREGEVLVDAQNVSKKYCRSLKRSLWYGVRDIANSLLPWSASVSPNGGRAAGVLPSLRRDEFWALRDVSFQVKRGECLGLVGNNGAGKSSLLKILNDLNRPDGGCVTIRGRVAALIELNAGFNPVLTGRENIYNQAALLGLSKVETDSRFDEIVQFAELEESIDMPLQNYSSGMKVRLGFAVTSQLQPDVMLVDEVLAVGDVGFRYKCMNRIAELQQDCAFIFVSHSMPAIARVCTHVLHLDGGRPLLYTNSVEEGIDSYYRMFDVGEETSHGSGEVEINRVTPVFPLESAPSTVRISHGDSLEVEVECHLKPGCNEATLQMVIWNQEMMPVVDVLASGMRRQLIRRGPNGRSIVRCRIDDLELNTGTFQISLVALSVDGRTTYLRKDRALILQVTSNAGSACSITKEAQWQTMGDA